MMKRLLPLLLLIVAIGISGCAGIGSLQGTQPTTLSCVGAGVTDGIAITDWSFDFNQIYADEAVGLTLTAENFGGSEGTLTSYNIFGPDIVTSGATDVQWTSDKATAGTITTAVGTLAPPNPDLGMPGGMYTDTFTMTAPSGLTVETPFTFNLRLTYDYATSFSGILSVMSTEYLRSLPADERKALIQSGGLSASCFTGGPIKVEGAAGTHFVNPEGTSLTGKPIRFKVTNVGTGFPFVSSTHSYDGIDTDTMYKISVVSATGLDCSDAIANPIVLSRGQVGTFSCTISSGITTPSMKTDYSFQVNLEYQYWQDTSTSIKVLRPL